MIQSKVISKNVSHNISQGVVRAAKSDIDHGWRSQSRRMVTILSDTVICHSPLCYTHSLQMLSICRLFVGRYSYFSLLQNLWTTLYLSHLHLSSHLEVTVWLKIFELASVLLPFKPVLATVGNRHAWMCRKTIFRLLCTVTNKSNVKHDILAGYLLWGQRKRRGSCIVARLKRFSFM